MLLNKTIILLLAYSLLGNFAQSETDSKAVKSKAVIVWQPSHQTDTGKDFSEAIVCNGIIEAAMVAKPQFKEYKVWSLHEPNLHHANVGSNTIIEHTSALIDGKLSGYAYELKESNKRKPDVFISVHNNGGTQKHAIWGFIHEGDPYEAENRGVLLDSSTGRNDYVCKSTGKKAFYSLDEHVNTAKYRVLLEVGDNAISKDFLENPANQKKMGEAIKTELAKWLAEKGLN